MFSLSRAKNGERQKTREEWPQLKQALKRIYEPEYVLTIDEAMTLYTQVYNICTSTLPITEAESRLKGGSGGRGSGEILYDCIIKFIGTHRLPYDAKRCKHDMLKIFAYLSRSWIAGVGAKGYHLPCTIEEVLSQQQKQKKYNTY